MRSKFILVAAALGAAACNVSSATDATSSSPTPIVYTISFDSGTVDSASVPAGSVISLRLHVTRAGTAVPGALVTWAVSAGHGLLSSTSTTTDTLGASSVLWTLGDTVGLNTISVASFDASATLRAVGTAGPVSSLIKLSPDSAAVVATASLPLTVRAVDRVGNPVSGAVVRWTSSGGDLSTTSAVTGTTGNSETVFITGASSSTYFVTAALPGRASVTFKIVGF